MHKSTKAAVAAAGAGALLLGGAGSLAYWTGTEDVPGGSFTSGYLAITGSTCAAAAWTLDGGAAYTTQRIVPGDALTKTCSFTVDGAGDHLSVVLDTATPTWSASNGLTSDLSVAATFSGDGGVLTDPATIAAGETVTAVITVRFDGGDGDGDASDVDNASNVSTAGLTAALQDVTITATQGHSAS